MSSRQTGQDRSSDTSSASATRACWCRRISARRSCFSFCRAAFSDSSLSRSISPKKRSSMSSTVGEAWLDEGCTGHSVGVPLDGTLLSCVSARCSIHVRRCARSAWNASASICHLIPAPFNSAVDMAKPTVSAAEKRDKLRAMLLKTCKVINNKELEGPISRKLKISGMIIKDVMKELVDNDLVDSDKIGASTYYWCFPSKESQNVVSKLEGLERLEVEVRADEEAARARLEALQAGREDTDERRALISERRALLGELAAQNEQLRFRAEHSPESIELKRLALAAYVEGANRWTDNVFQTQSYLVRKRHMDRKEVQRILGITASFDYVEDA
eukprot:gnl/Chilomastix_cuspidata/4544.p1 GENE.gnl/Chilomastix_cuspidata/4544~~gnl/Chilomastix_cuspidata/4544.p1  ORF type:complete len:331 (-),score=118.78 gnl/Chilomastix_cuspidata/4544:53-1045(-)